MILNTILHLTLWICYTAASIPYPGPLTTAKHVPARQAVAQTASSTSIQAPRTSQASSLDDPPEVCGYEQALYRWACPAYSTCLWNLDLRAVGCCRDPATTTSCDFHTSCVDYAHQQSCTGPCTSNSLVLRCSISATPYCNTAYFGAKYDNFAFFCGTATLYYEVFYSSINSANLTSTMTNVPRYIGAATAVTTYTPASTVLTSFSTSSSQVTSEPISQSARPDIGIIVGGSVGGFLALCIIGVGIAWAVIRNKRKAAHHPASQTGPAPNAPEMQLYGAAYWHEMDGQGGRKVHNLSPEVPRAELNSETRYY